MSITVCGSILGGVVPSVKPENKSVMRMCPGLSSTLFMVSTCTNLNLKADAIIYFHSETLVMQEGSWARPKGSETMYTAGFGTI